jgi:hypothetical protein
MPSTSMTRAPGTGHNHGQQPEARGTALIGTFTAQVLLDGVDLANARDGFGGDRRIAALGNLEELASQVAPAKGNCDPVRGHLLVRGIAVALHDAVIPARRFRRRPADQLRPRAGNAFNVSSTLPRTIRSRWLLIRSSSIVMTLPSGLSVGAPPNGGYRRTQISPIMSQCSGTILRRGSSCLWMSGR